MRYNIKRWYEDHKNDIAELKDCERLEVVKQAIKAIDYGQNFEAKTSSGPGLEPGKVTMQDCSQMAANEIKRDNIDSRIDVSLTKLQEAIRWLVDVKGNKCGIADGVYLAKECCKVALNIL